jgi:hypothetical protein
MHIGTTDEKENEVRYYFGSADRQEAGVNIKRSTFGVGKAADCYSDWLIAPAHSAPLVLAFTNVQEKHCSE